MNQPEYLLIQEQLRHIESIVRELRLTEFILASSPGETRQKAMALLPFQEAVRTDPPAWALTPMGIPIPVDETASPRSE